MAKMFPNKNNDRPYAYPIPIEWSGGDKETPGSEFPKFFTFRTKAFAQVNAG
jgi:hypothetical protein